MTQNIELVPFDEIKLRAVWELGFRDAEPEWARWDAPYFQEYQAYESFEDFASSGVAAFLLSEGVRCIQVEGQAVGMVSRTWEDRRTRWMEVGIVIYDANRWNTGVGRKALEKWTTDTFARFPELEHLGLTTWSGNARMMSCAKRLGWQQEACIRRVRYWQGTYYDSVKYGVLREEWGK